jgi:hypothetical protein
MNIFARATIFGAVFVLAALAWAAGILVRSTYVTNVDNVREQPVPFSHEHHVGELGLDCRYCHISVEKSAFAGLPTTDICMGCHSQVWKNSEMLAPVRESARTGKPLEWTRVHDLPDFVYFNHSIHVAKGIGCQSCHGRVNEMPLMRKSATLYMEWCIECHRHPEAAVRNTADIYKFDVRPQDQNELVTSSDIDNSESTRQPEATSARPPSTGSQPAKLLSAKDDYEQFLRSIHSKGPLLEQEPDARDGSTAAKARLTGLGLVQKYGIVTKQLTDCAICHR